MGSNEPIEPTITRALVYNNGGQRMQVKLHCTLVEGDSEGVPLKSDIVLHIFFVLKAQNL